MPSIASESHNIWGKKINEVFVLQMSSERGWEDVKDLPNLEEAEKWRNACMRNRPEKNWQIVRRVTIDEVAVHFWR